MTYRILCTALIGTFLLGACSTSARPPKEPPKEVKTLEQITTKEIQRFIDTDEASRALQWIYSLKTERPDFLAKDDMDRLEKEGKGKLAALFDKAVQEKKFDRALAYFISMENLKSFPDGFSWDRNRIVFQEAENARNQGNLTLALYGFLRMTDFAALSDEDLRNYAEISFKLNHLSALQRIKRIYELRKRPFPEDFAETKLKPFSPPDLMGGAVTIWVNRGIKIERGIGLPDRVIGSGFYIDPRGYLLTNYHVITSEVDPTYEGYSRLYIRPTNRPEEKIPAKVIGYDRIFDIALLKAEVEPAFVFGFTEVQELQVGTRVLAIGSPGGLENTITSGIVSATGRRFLQMGDAMQMDVAVNPGSSGGPLVDEQGRLVGVVFAGIEQFQGVNFAIPGFWVRKFLPKLYNQGEVVHSWLGLSVNENKTDLEVLYVAPGSPAQEAKLQVGDRVTKINNVQVKSIRDAQNVLLGIEPDSLVPVVYSRGTQERSSLLALQKRPFSPLERPLEFDARERLFPALFGFSARTLSTGIFSDDFMVERVLPGSVADETSISENDPFNVKAWVVDKKKRIVLMQMVIKKRKAGFLEGGIQLGAYFEQNNFI